MSFSVLFFFFICPLPPRPKRTDTLFPYTTLVRSYAQFGNVLRGEVQLGCGLEDQLLGQALIIFRFEPRGDVALVRKEQGPVDLEPVRSQALHIQHGVAAIRPGAKIVTDAGLKVPPRVERTAPERSEEHTSELQSLMRISYAVFCLKNKSSPPNNKQ